MLNSTVHRELSWIWCVFSHKLLVGKQYSVLCLTDPGSVHYLKSAQRMLQGHILRLTLILFTMFSIFGYVCVYEATWPVMTSSCKYSIWATACFSQPRLCMATDGQQWEWAADQLRPPVATWRRVRGTRSGSSRAGSEAPSPLARRGSCSCWWRRRSAGWSGRVRCVSLHYQAFFNICARYSRINSIWSQNITKPELNAVRLAAEKCETWAINCASGSCITVINVLSQSTKKILSV